MNLCLQRNALSVDYGNKKKEIRLEKNSEDIIMGIVFIDRVIQHSMLHIRSLLTVPQK